MVFHPNFSHLFVSNLPQRRPNEKKSIFRNPHNLAEVCRIWHGSNFGGCRVLNLVKISGFTSEPAYCCGVP